MKISKSLGSAAVVVALAAIPMASNAALALRFSDGINTFLVNDEDASDMASGTAGIVSFSGLLFGNWTVATGTGTSEFDPLRMHLNASYSAVMANFGVGESKVLTIEVGQTGLGLDGNVTFNAFGGGSGQGAVSWAAFADDSNALFGDASQIHSSVGYLNSSGNAVFPMAAPYSAMLRTRFDLSNVSSVVAGGSLDLDLYVPEPGSVALTAIALLALGAVTRRKA